MVQPGFWLLFSPLPFGKDNPLEPFVLHGQVVTLCWPFLQELNICLRATQAVDGH